MLYGIHVLLIHPVQPQCIDNHGEYSPLPGTSSDFMSLFHSCLLATTDGRSCLISLVSVTL